MNLIELKHLDIKFSKKVFLTDINWNIIKGKIYHLVGGNGSGKSTLLSEIAKRSKNIDTGYLPQVALQYPKVHFLLKDISDTAYNFYDESLFHKSWHKSSGGERKKALIAKTITEGKELLILDEPFNHLDKTSCAQIISHIESLAKKGVTVIYTAHENVIDSSIEVEVDKWRF